MGGQHDGFQPLVVRYKLPLDNILNYYYLLMANKFCFVLLKYRSGT